MTNKVNRPLKPPGRRLRRLFLCIKFSFLPYIGYTQFNSIWISISIYLKKGGTVLGQIVFFEQLFTFFLSKIVYN